MSLFISFIVGVIFALGLGISGMTRVDVVRGFLDVFGNWNPALIGVMIGAIAVHSIFYFLVIKKQGSPLLAKEFNLPTKKELDQKLILGSALFGLGWGWAGICPGPGVVSLTSLQSPFLIFVPSMLLGMAFFKYFLQRWI